jgi:hypothetical protein
MAELDRVQKNYRETYSGFLSLTKIAVIAITIVLIAMAIFLV